jgi:hypothetical protein
MQLKINKVFYSTGKVYKVLEIIGPSLREFLDNNSNSNGILKLKFSSKPFSYY